MSFLNRLFGSTPRPDPRRELADTARRVDAFMRACTSVLDPRDLTIPDKRERLALFLYGAVQALAPDAGLDEGRALAVLVMVLSGSGRMAEQEVSHLVGAAMERSSQPEGRPMVQHGSLAMSQWLAGEAGSAAARLQQVMQDQPPHTTTP